MAVVVMYSSVLYRRTGLVGRWAYSVARHFTLNAKIAAPKRSGELAAGIVSEVELSAAMHTAEMAISSTAPHTMYVLKGTTGPIMSKRLWGFWSRGGGQNYGRWPRGMNNAGRPDLITGNRMGYVMRLRPGKGHGALLKATVSGQEANNFFGTAADMTAMQHTSLRGFSPGFRL